MDAQVKAQEEMRGDRSVLRDQLAEIVSLRKSRYNNAIEALSYSNSAILKKIESLMRQRAVSRSRWQKKVTVGRGRWLASFL